MSQPINLDAESNIRGWKMIKSGFDLKRDNNESASEENSHALVVVAGCTTYGWQAAASALPS